MSEIHPSAVVGAKAQIGENVVIAPFAYVEDDVVIGDNSFIGPHACIYNGARIGSGVKIFQSAAVSNLPQDLKYAGEEAFFYIGDNTVIREFVTLHKGTVETGFSKVGKNCLLMAYAHVAHDCIVGDNVIIANSVQIGGHVKIDDHVIIGGSTPVHQFTQIGMHAMIGGGFRITVDIPPFVLAANEPLRYTGLNTIGLRRRGFSNDEIFTLKKAYEMLYSSGMNLSLAKEKIQETFKDDKNVQLIVEFINRANRSLLRK